LPATLLFLDFFEAALDLLFDAGFDLALGISEI
jgi:hypothetical protein